MSAARAAELQQWHEDTSAALAAQDAHDVEYLGLPLHVPAEVFPPTPVSDLLGSAVVAHARPGQRVLDMGCGAGANALLAARRGADVLGVDVNPSAVQASRANAQANGLADRCRFAVSDLFDEVDGAFDLVVIDPPFRWFAPRSLLDRAVTDEGYRTLTRFVGEVPERLRPGGAVLLFFGSSGDVAYLDELLDASPLTSTTVAEREHLARGEVVTYEVRRLAAA